MKTLITETLKTVLLCVMIIIGAILSQALGLFGEPAAAKALRCKEIVDQANGVFILTRKERGEYMKYLQTLGGVATNKPIYKIELP